MEGATHIGAGTQLETKSTSTVTMDMSVMVAPMQSASIASRPDEHTGLTNHQSADVSYRIQNEYMSG